MAKQSPAKAKKLRGEAMRAAAQRRAERAASRCEVTRGEVDLDAYAEVDGVWRELGLAAPARRALVNNKILKVSDLKKFTKGEVAAFHGMGPNAMAKLVAAKVKFK